MIGRASVQLPEDALQREIVVVDIGGTHVRVGHVSAGKPSSTITTTSSVVLQTTDARTKLAELAKAHAEHHGLSPAVVVMGLPGLINQTQDTFDHCNNIPQLEGAGLRHQLSQLLDCAVLVEQDIMLQLLGEHRKGSVRDSPAVLAVYFGTGIGAAYLQDGNPFRRGASSLQAGHIPMLARGTPCLCGNKDCVESHASGHTLQALAVRSGVPVDKLFSHRLNPEIDQALDEFVMLQAWMVATAVTLLEPDDVLIGGGITEMADYPLDTLERIIRDHLQRPIPASTVCISRAALEKLSALYGALALIDLHTRDMSHHTHTHQRKSTS